MGNVMKLILRRTSKPIREYNIEARVEKIITKEKPTPAPYHPGTENLLKCADTPEVKRSLFEADSELLKRLEKVYVTSHDPSVLKGSEKSSESSRPMPISKEYVEEPSYGYHEPKKISYGKTTLKNTLEFLAKFQQSPAEWNAPKIAEVYKLDNRDTENVLKYFSTFILIMPPEAQKKVPKTLVTAAMESLGAHSVVRLPTLSVPKAPSLSKPTEKSGSII